ncbi:hypothetical protein GCM10022225_52160 [Plantactinospora mayteni]|uniref:Uncharacterized protein n=1 Tax=Plantactinospora mayteni TaxID=566021 RepID=A0ABQ4EZ08_9ACTN|nr:hypothetical protein [Plantactinospora mayteni]GIG99867.1 hypothetical protein Pma05_64400 [Plantactinospora mayteni]
MGGPDLGPPIAVSSGRSGAGSGLVRVGLFGVRADVAPELRVPFPQGRTPVLLHHDGPADVGEPAWFRP